MGRAASAQKRSALPGAGPETAVNTHIAACPSPRRARGVCRGPIDDRGRHPLARQCRKRLEYDRFCRDIAKSAAPRRAAPRAGAFFHLDFCTLRNQLYNAGVAGRPDPHRNRRVSYREFRERWRNKGDENAEPKTEAHNLPHIFVARHVGPFGPKAGSMRKLSLAVIVPRDKVSSGMTSVAWSPTNMITWRFCSSSVFAIARKASK